MTELEAPMEREEAIETLEDAIAIVAYLQAVNRDSMGTISKTRKRLQHYRDLMEERG